VDTRGLFIRDGSSSLSVRAADKHSVKFITCSPGGSLKVRFFYFILFKMNNLEECEDDTAA